MFLQPQTAYEFGPFRVDTRERQLLRAGEVVPLTPKVFDVLLALIQNRGHILTKNEVINPVWPECRQGSPDFETKRRRCPACELFFKDGNVMQVVHICPNIRMGPMCVTTDMFFGRLITLLRVFRHRRVDEFAVALTAYLRGRHAEVSIDSIAVLPFENRSGDTEPSIFLTVWLNP